MNMNRSISTSGARRILALVVALIIGVLLGIFLSGNRPDKETPLAKETPTAKHKSKKETALIRSVSAAAEFRERHNHALSPEAREDNRRNLWKKNFPWKSAYDPAVKVTQELASDRPEELTLV